MPNKLISIFLILFANSFAFAAENGKPQNDLRENDENITVSGTLAINPIDSIYSIADFKRYGDKKQIQALKLETLYDLSDQDLLTGFIFCVEATGIKQLGIEALLLPLPVLKPIAHQIKPSLVTGNAIAIAAYINRTKILPEALEQLVAQYAALGEPISLFDCHSNGQIELMLPLNNRTIRAHLTCISNNNYPFEKDLAKKIKHRSDLPEKTAAQVKDRLRPRMILPCRPKSKKPQEKKDNKSREANLKKMYKILAELDDLKSQGKQ